MQTFLNLRADGFDLFWLFVFRNYRKSFLLDVAKGGDLSEAEDESDLQLGIVDPDGAPIEKKPTVAI